MLQVILGDHDRTTTGEGILPEKTVNVSALHIHNYDRNRGPENDIAVLELAEEVDLNTYTPACMAQVWTHLKLNANCVTSEYGHRDILREDCAS